MENTIKTIKLSKIEFEVNLKTAYKQVHANKANLNKNDIVLIAQELGLPVIKPNKNKADLIDILMNHIYNSNYIDNMFENYSKTV